MTTYSISIPDEVAETIRKTAKLRGISEDQCAADLLSAHHQEMIQFPDGVLREGRKQLVDLLSPIPCLSEFDSSGVDFRFWWVRFQIDTASPCAWPVIAWLGGYLNTQAAEMRLPTVVRPVPYGCPTDPMTWEIVSTEPRLDPLDVVDWLSRHLPDAPSSPESWSKLEWV